MYEANEQSGPEVVERLEMQMPTRLRRGYENYEQRHDWQSQVGQTAAETRGNLAKWGERVDMRWDSWAYELYDQAQEIYSHLDGTSRAKVEEFRAKKTHFFRDFAWKYRDVLRIFKETGILEIEKEDQKGDISWRIVSEHSLIVAKVAEILARKLIPKLLEEKFGREEIDMAALASRTEKFRQQAIEEVVVGALLQDVNKRQEIEFKKLSFADQKGKLAALGAEEADLKKVDETPALAVGIYERLSQIQTKNEYEKLFGDRLKKWGNAQTIIACSKAAGMPVVDNTELHDRTGHYLGSLAERIANLADKLVQDTGLITDLEIRHQACRERYKPVDKVDEEYRYAQQCMQELLSGLSEISEVKQFPAMIFERMFSEINAYKLPKAA